MEFVSDNGLTQDGYHHLKLEGITLRGLSLAGVETLISIPEMGVTFDTGRAPDFAIHHDVLALSHWHLDHAGGVPHFLGLRCLNNLKPLKIMCPEQTIESAEHYLESLKILCESELHFQLLSAQTPLEIKPKVYLEGIENAHCLPSTGYGIIEKRNKLKEKFKNHSQEEIIKAKNKGIAIEDEVELLQVAFSGDTTGDFFQTEATKAETLIMECSFFTEDADFSKIKHFGHTHIHEWADYADRIESKNVIMIHTSRRYTKKQIREYCLKRLPKHLTDRLIVFR